MRKIDVSSGELNYISFGEGKKNLIIIPGLSVSDLEDYGVTLPTVYDIFSKEYKVYFFDRRSKVLSDVTIENFAEDIYEAMNKLEINKADIYGVSQGGMIAMSLAINHSEMVSKLVLGSTSSKLSETLNNKISDWIKMSNEHDTISLNRDMFENLFTENYLNKHKDIIEKMVESIKPKSYERFSAIANSILKFDCYEDLSKINCPTFVFYGEQDKVTTANAARNIADKLKCEFYEYKEYGHGVYDEAGDIKARIYEFLMK